MYSIILINIFIFNNIIFMKNNLNIYILIIFHKYVNINIVYDEIF